MLPNVAKWPNGQMIWPTCFHCGLNFCNKSSLRRHISQIHNPQRERPHGCTQCGKRFYEKRWLTQHSEIHKEQRERPHLCSVCGKQFYRKRELVAHLKLHRNPHVCSVCGKQFFSKRELVAHLKLHRRRPSRPIRCDMWIVERMRYRQTDRPTDGQSQL